VTLLVRACLKRYYDCWLVCDDPSCGRRTMQQSVKGECCRRCESRVFVQTVKRLDEFTLCL
jgi:hypothetical protein